MGDAEKVKVIVLGPKGAGKSCVANYIARYKDIFGSEYRPTIALRICEFERDGLQFVRTQIAKKGTGRCSVELWDTSGNTQFQSCWPAIMKDAHAVLFVYNPTTYSEKDLEYWYKTCVVGKIKDSCCLIFCHHKNPQTMKGSEVQVPKSMEKIRAVETCLDLPNNVARQEFDKLLENVVISRREQEENSVMGVSSARPRSSMVTPTSASPSVATAEAESSGVEPSNSS